MTIAGPTALAAATAPSQTSATMIPTPGTGSGTSEAEEVEAIRRIITQYWEALNDYDVDHAITMLEPAYRAAEEEQIRRDIGRMKMFRAKLGVSEESPPTLNAEGDYETYLSVKTPVDTRRVLMVFRQIDGAWWIVYSEEVD